MRFLGGTEKIGTFGSRNFFFDFPVIFPITNLIWRKSFKRLYRVPCKTGAPVGDFLVHTLLGIVYKV